MRRIKFLAPLVVLMLLSFGFPGTSLAADPPPPPLQHPDVPRCVDMPAAQIPGTKPGSACQLSVVIHSGGMGIVLSYGRTGDTVMFTTRSDSDIIEDEIKADAYLYAWYPSLQLWQLVGPPCSDPQTNSSHAACRTYWYGGTGINLAQEGYHYWINSTYGNESLETYDNWFS